MKLLKKKLLRRVEGSCVIPCPMFLATVYGHVLLVRVTDFPN